MLRERLAEVLGRGVGEGQAVEYGVPLAAPRCDGLKGPEANAQAGRGSPLWLAPWLSEATHPVGFDFELWAKRRAGRMHRVLAERLGTNRGGLPLWLGRALAFLLLSIACKARCP